MKKNGTMSRLSIFNNPYEEFFKEDLKESLKQVKSKINDVPTGDIDIDLLQQLSSYYFDLLERARELGIGF
jgi:ribosome recycling factor